MNIFIIVVVGAFLHQLHAQSDCLIVNSQSFNDENIFVLRGDECTSNFQIAFEDFNFQDSTGCVEQRLEIGTQDAQCGRRSFTKTYRAEQNHSLVLKLVYNERKPEILRLKVTKIGQCLCESQSTSRLVSPNFPQSLLTPTTCVFTIRKSSSKVCRLRLKVLFFSMGSDNQECPEGYLSVNEALECGCKSASHLSATFGESDALELKFHSEGGVSGHSGFVLDILQDECEKTQKFKFYEDQANRVTWPNGGIQQLQLIKERSFKFKDNIEKHFYFFGSSEEEDREEVTTEISQNTAQCVAWNSAQLKLLQSNNLHQDHDDCIELQEASGIIQTPGFPLAYTSNTRFCYRWNLPPETCGLQLHFNHFFLENSYQCFKDYVQINEFKYCSDFLNGKRVSVDTKGKPYQDLHFASDANYCGSGFSAWYQQVRCADTASIRPEKESGKASCHRIISGKYFVIRNEMEEARGGVCTYDITKYSEKVCKIHFTFQYFNLPCHLGVLKINERAFCGQRSGQSFTMDFSEDLKLIYRQLFQLGSTVTVQGEQIDCEIHVPEPARFTKSLENGLCDLIQNSIPEEELPNQLCQVLVQKYENVECVAYPQTFFDPVNILVGKTMRVKVTDKETGSLMHYEDIQCPNSDLS